MKTTLREFYVIREDATTDPRTEQLITKYAGMFFDAAFGKKGGQPFPAQAKELLRQFSQELKSGASAGPATGFHTK